MTQPEAYDLLKGVSDAQIVASEINAYAQALRNSTTDGPQNDAALETAWNTIRAIEQIWEERRDK